MNDYEKMYTEMVAKSEKQNGVTTVRLLNGYYHLILKSLVFMAWLENKKHDLYSELIAEMQMDR